MEVGFLQMYSRLHISLYSFLPSLVHMVYLQMLWIDVISFQSKFWILIPGDLAESTDFSTQRGAIPWQTLPSLMPSRHPDDFFPREKKQIDQIVKLPYSSSKSHCKSESLIHR